MVEGRWVNYRWVGIGGLAGGVVWSAWNAFINLWVLQARYDAAAEGGRLLLEPRYDFFTIGSYLILFVLSLIIIWLYAWVRPARGPGPKTALPIGLVVGFAAGLPIDYYVACLIDVDKLFPLWWMLDFWIGAILAALVGGWLYRD